MLDAYYLQQQIDQLKKRCCCSSFGVTDGAPVGAPTGSATTVRIDPDTSIVYRWSGTEWVVVGPKRYVATLTQTGIDPPEAVVSRNDFTGISWERVDVGDYHIKNTNNEFVQGKTFVWMTSHNEAGPSGGSQWHTWGTESEIHIHTANPDGTVFMDELLGINSNGNGTPFVIEVWP